MAADHVRGGALAARISRAPTTFSGWLFASARGWSVSWFFVAPLRMLTSGDRTPVKVLDGWHQNFLWALLVVAGLHVAAALVHLFYFRDGGHAADAAERACDWSRWASPSNRRVMVKSSCSEVAFLAHRYIIERPHECPLFWVNRT